MTPDFLRRFRQLIIISLSAALYVACGPTGNEETDPVGEPGTEMFAPENPVPLRFSPSGSVSKFTITDDLIRVPETPFTDSTGVERVMSDFKGKALLINFWATWCGPCKHEMPSLDRLQAGHGDDTFMVLTISNDRAGARAVDPYFEEAGIGSLDKFYDSKTELSRALGVKGLPTTILVDSEGYERGRIEGPAEWDSPEALALIKRVIRDQK